VNFHVLVCELCEFIFVTHLFFVNIVLRASPTQWADRVRGTTRLDLVSFMPCLYQLLSPQASTTRHGSEIVLCLARTIRVVLDSARAVPARHARMNMYSADVLFILDGGVTR
jgi:hypothetical protein